MTDLGPIYQAAYVVPNLETAILDWVRVSGAGPFFVVPHFVMADPELYGKPAPCDLSIALGYSGELCVELIQQHDEKPSVYRSVIDSGQYGFHHFARLARDVDATIADYERAAVPCAFRARMLTNSRLAYLDARRSSNCFIEIVSDDDEVRSTLAVISGAARNWDRSEPIRLLV